MFINRFVSSGALIAVAAIFAAGSASAQMTLTPAGASRGFQLTTFVDNVTIGNLGPIGLDYFNGGVTVSAYNGEVRQFSNIDNQNWAAGSIIGSYGQNNGTGLAHFGAQQYMAEQNAGRVVALPSGTQVGSNIGFATGLVANNSNGLLYVSTGSQVWTLNPANGATNVFGNIPADGLSLSLTGDILYAALNNGHVVGYDANTAAQVFDSGFIPGGIDGTAVGFGTRLGYLYVNTNGGTIVEVNLGTLEQTLISSGGSRGDFVASDPSGSGDLLLTQYDRVLRLSGIPTPGTAALLGLAGLVATRRRRLA
ncbi:MAG: hypothetical protein WC718_10885 [Phycisphaerales bacterium]|jgi:MYXO-CTERM domain-containing protein